LNDEKTVMLKEIHHRVKNNLQIVTSLLRLQAHELNDPKLTSEFSEAIDRISAISKIHDKMYNNKALNQIDLSEYLEDLIKDLVESYSNERVIETTINTNISAIPPKDLVPIALLFNELVTNSVKHAFKNKEKCQIQIDAIATDKINVKLTYQDNGSWVNPNVDSKSIGLELIDSFVDQLDGTYHIDKTNGTRYEILYTIKE
jgi:two-component sensor histidine kinase